MPSVQREARRQREAAAVCERLAGLSLSRAQARQLVPIVETAAGLLIEAYEEEAARLAETVWAFSDFAEEDRLNQGFTPVVERRAARLSRQDHEAREAACERLRASEEQAAKLLTAQQRSILESDAGGAKRGGSGAMRSAGRRDWRQSQQSEAVDARLQELRAELEVLRERKSPQPGPLGRCLFHPAAYEPLCQTGGVKPSQTLRQAMAVWERGTLEYPRSEPATRAEMIDGVRSYLRSTQRQPAIVKSYFHAESVRYAAG